MFSLAKPSLKGVGFTLSPVKLFVLSTMVVNAGNYTYNLTLGNTLSPAQFAEAGFVVTLLLVFSFLAMTFQIAATKFSIEYSGEERTQFKEWLQRLTLQIGVGLAALLIIFSGTISEFFQLSSHWIIVLFGTGLPLYFQMSVERGFVQGSQDFLKLSLSYQAEMWSRFSFTFLLFAFLPFSIGLNIAIAVIISIVVGFVSTGGKLSLVSSKSKLFDAKKVIVFIAFTAGYELGQILINYSDMLLVKHYFDATDAGHYTSIALIGRMIYFVTWMVVMVLIPTVIEQSKAGKNVKPLLLRYFGLIAAVSFCLVFGAFLFPQLAVSLLFGNEYLPVANLLWMYGLATSLFALANLLVYFFLSLNYYKPVWVAIFFGLLQVALLLFFHESLAQIVLVQIANMGVLLIVQGVFFIRWR